MKVLIIRFSSIGDIVLTTPIIRALKLQLPDVEIDYCTKSVYKPLLENNPYIHQIITLDKGESIGGLLQKLRQKKYDIVIDLHNKLRSRLLLLLLGRKSYILHKYTWQRILLILTKINKVPQKHIVDFYFDTIMPLGVINDGKGLEFHMPSDLYQTPIEIQEIVGPKYVAFVIGGSKTTKITPIETMIRVVGKIVYPIVLVGGKEDQERGKHLIEAVEKSTATRPQIYNACGGYNFLKSASILNGAQFVISHDTGMMHIAVSLKKKVYALWGPTLPTLFGPYSKDAVVIENNTLDCRPCSKSGGDYCPLKHFKCMRELPLETVTFQ